jgi:hypothetical protein
MKTFYASIDASVAQRNVSMEIARNVVPCVSIFANTSVVGLLCSYIFQKSCFFLCFKNFFFSDRAARKKKIFFERKKTRFLENI